MIVKSQLIPLHTVSHFLSLSMDPSGTNACGHISLIFFPKVLPLPQENINAKQFAFPEVNKGKKNNNARKNNNKNNGLPNFLFLPLRWFCQSNSFLPDPHLVSFCSYIISLCMSLCCHQAATQSSSIRYSSATSLTSWPSILHNHGNTQIRTWSMERRRCLGLHIQARSSQLAFQIKADEMVVSVTVCVLVCVPLCVNVLVQRDRR